MNSVLNPEAPEFYPHLTSVTQGGYRSMHKSVLSSNTLPSGFSYDLFKTYTDFNIVTCQLSENVLTQRNQIIAAELPAVKLKHKNEYTTEVYNDANDSLLDRVNINLDTVTGVNEPSVEFMKSIPDERNIPAWNTKPIIAKIQVGSATFIGAKNIPRPQLNFKDTIDNSESLWVPKISDKPNNIKPLALNILYNDEGEAVGYEHPYKVELDLYHPPAHFLEPTAEEVPFPPSLEETTYTYVDTEEKLDALVEHLNTVNELAVDLEHHSYRTYQGITCLIQITTNEGGDFIIDALAIRQHIHKLNLAFTDPKKIKVFHGAERDVIWLQRDFGVYLVGLFDTHQAAKMLDLHGLSLKYLLLKYCRVDADKKYQLADWRMRPLPDELIQYARMDTHYLLYIWKQMKAELLSNAGSQHHLLLSVFEHSRQLCEATYNKEVITETSHMPLYLRFKKSFNSRQMAALKMLYKWRDTQARMLDESTQYLLPNHMLLSLAETLPREMQGVNAVCSPMPPFVKQNLITIHRMILSCRELPNEPLLYQMPTSVRQMMQPTMRLSYDIHDILPEHSEERNLEQAIDMYANSQYIHPTLEIVPPDHEAMKPDTIVSALNVDAEQFIPPFDRYRKYRSLAQMDEIKEFNDKEAKIAAIGKGNELIEKEVLNKLQQAKTHIENEEKKNVPTSVAQEIDDSDTLKKTQQRKRKMSTDKPDHKESVDVPVEDKEQPSCSYKKPDSNVKPYAYKNVDYKKFYNDTNKEHKQKQPKMNYKKYKK
ncbi:exosome component Rrp6 [Anticarsia gemmatalis]|uniref:exosome component Rrp6 n=1 Tax=Anticarsia gemmatalis TaxID=129554 RepID=UPI003F766DD7